MGNCMSNTGNFEPPGSQALQSYIAQHEAQTDPVKVALRRAQERARAAEKRVSAENVVPVKPVKPKGPKCSVCFKHCQISVNPWQRTRSDRMVAEISDDSDDESDEVAEVPVDGERPPRMPRKQVIHGIQLASCKHYFCGGCLAQAIYNRLNISFDPARDYGTVLRAPAAATPGRRAEFPISCPTCQVKPGEEPIEISDMTARLVLGEGNMDEWNHARFLSTLNLIYCPHKGCDETFDTDDVAPAPSGVNHAATLVQVGVQFLYSVFSLFFVQCPRCRGSLCKACKSVWHDNLTCEAYQALPMTERAPEDVAFANLAMQEKWRRCPKCSAMVELKYGCKHHFCYTCGADFEHSGGKYRCKGGVGCKVWEEQNLLDRDG
ncbi:hypothetical protein B0H19DRAFT_669789 [Mycena capillaripes]|nr:hypothetical protein B0H19DRAFT_669789 [Mycena capillaripes]